MADVLSSGRDPDRRRRRLPRRALALIAALLTAATATGYFATARHRSTPAPPAAPAAAAPAILPVQPTSADPVAPSWLRCGGRCDVPVLHARTGLGPNGLQLLVNTNPPTLLDGTGRRHRGPRVPLRRGEHIETLLPMGREVAALVQADYVTETTAPGRIYRIAGNGSVALIGRADAIAQGIGATLWTITYPPRSASPGGSEPASYTLTEIDRTGQILARHSEPQNIVVIRATKAGLLVTLPKGAYPSHGSSFGQTDSLRLLDPTTGKLGKVLSHAVFAVLDVTDNLVAWSSPRGPLVKIYDLTRQEIVGIYSAPGYHPPDYGRLSPDGRTLVLGFSGLPQLGTNPASYGYLELLDLPTRRISRMDGLRTPPKNNPQLDWTADSRSLILSIDDRTAARIALWERQAPGLLVLPGVIPHSHYTGLTYLPRGSG